MAEYMIRVVLHGADGGQYEKLHDEMVASGAARSIKSDDGDCYDLPDAEYYLETDRSGGDVRDIVISIASRIRANPSVLVSQASRFFWRLKLVPGES